jgi:hypothetical protein
MYTHYPDTISSTLYPIMYRNIQPDGVEQLYVSIFVAGANVGNYRASYSSTSGTSGVFLLDTSGYVGANVAPAVDQITSIFGTLDDWYRSSNTDCFKSTYINVYPETINTSGYLVTSTAAQVSTTGYALSADTWDYNYNLSIFQMPLGDGQFQFLTAKREARRVGDADNIFLSYLTYGVDSAEFIFYNTAGAVASTVVVDLVHAFTDYGMQTFSAGLTNILGEVAGGTLVIHSGTFPTTSTGLSYYTVGLGVYSGVFIQSSETLTFLIEQGCPDKLELHWFGKYGGAESYVFCGNFTDQVKTDSENIDVAQTWNYTAPRANSYDKRVLKTNIQSRKEIEVNTSIPQEDGEYVATLFESPEVYMVIAGKYVAVVIENATVPTLDNREVSLEVKFTILFGLKAVSGL